MGTEVEEPVKEVSELTQSVMLRDQIQKLRIAEGNRVSAAMAREEPERAEVHRTYLLRLETLEKDITKDVERVMKTHPIWPWLEKIRGVGPTNAALVVGMIDITRCDTISALWRYAGYAVIDGKAERSHKGEKNHFNARLKTMVWRLVDSQVKSRGPFRKFYDDAKHTYTTTRMEPVGEEAGWTLGHCEAAARRRAAKMFLAMLWLVWREAEGLPVREPWVAEFGGPGHTIISPWEFVEGSRKVEATR